MTESDLLEMLVQLSDAISKKDEKYVDMLRVLYRDLANVKTEREEAKSAFDLFKRLIAPGYLKPTDISVLFETVEVTGLKYLKDTIKKYETYPNEVKITRFSPYRQQVVALGKDFSVRALQKVSQLYEGNFSNPWKLIQHLEDTSVLSENSLSSFLQRLNENNVNEDFNKLLVRISEEISNEGEKYVDMLRVLYKDLTEFQTELKEAKSAFDLFKILRVADILKATNISVLFETIEVTGLRYLKEIIKTYETYPDDIKITQFSEHRQHLVALGKDFSTRNIKRVGQIYRVPDDFCSNPWKLITFLESKGIVSESNLSWFLKNLKSDVGNEEASTSKRPKLNKGKSEKSKQQQRKTRTLDKDYREPSISKRLKLNEDKIIKDALTRKQKEKYKNENTMTPAIWHHCHKLDIAEVFTELNLLQSKKEDKETQDKSTYNKKEGKPTSLTAALGVIKSTNSCKVLITGKGGMGKTTLLKYIAYKWATDDEHAFAGNLLFLINIREIKANEKLLDIIMKRIDSNGIIIKNYLNDKSVKNFLVKYDSEIVILLDGYDELEKDAKDTIELFNRSELQESTVVVTSRPDNTDELVNCCDVHIEVKGFSPSNIKNYIQNFFAINTNQNQNESSQKVCERKYGDSLINKLGLDSENSSITKCELGELLINKFNLNSNYKLDWGGDHKEAFELCSSPLLLLQICTIWEQKRVLPTYLTDLFKELICCFLNQYLNRAGNKTAIANFDRIPGLCKSCILILGEFMYEGLKENKLSIDKYVLEMAKDKKLVEKALELGFVYEDTPVNPGDLKEMYTPPHKLISEALAGLYLSTQIQEGNINLDEFEVIRSNKYLIMTRMFATGFLGADADKLLTPWLRIKASNYCSIVQCLTQVKEVHEKDILQKLDQHMSNDMKTYNKQMCATFLNDDKNISSMHIFKLITRCCIMQLFQLEEAAVSLMSTCRGIQCAAHNFFLLEVINWMNPFSVLHITERLLCECISKWKKEEINLLSAEMKKVNFEYNRIYCINFDFEISSAFLTHFLKYASDLFSLKLVGFNTPMCVTGTILNEVINDLYKAPIELKLELLDIQGNDLSDIDGTLLGKLFKLAPKLYSLNLSQCRLSGDILKEMITECQNNEEINESMEERGRMNVVLKDIMLKLKGNDLSDIDGKSLAEIVGAIFRYYHGPNADDTQCDDIDEDDLFHKFFRWSDYSLTVHNLTKLIESVGEDQKLNWQKIDFRNINLSSLSGKTLAGLFKIFPDLICIDARCCSLSGSIINEMMEECGRMNVVLKNNLLRLKGNDLSDIDGKSLADLVRAIDHCYFYLDDDEYDYDDEDYNVIFRWSNYSLTADNLIKLIESVDENMKLDWEKIDLRNINLSSLSGKTLASLFKISPDLKCIDARVCSLSGSIVNEMMEECGRMNVVLKDNMLKLKGNDLSDIDGKPLAELARIIDDWYLYDDDNNCWFDEDF